MTEVLGNSSSAPPGGEPFTTLDHPMGRLLEDHQVALAVVCISSLVMGVPLAVNTLWHLQVNSFILRPKYLPSQAYIETAYCTVRPQINLTERFRESRIHPRPDAGLTQSSRQVNEVCPVVAGGFQIIRRRLHLIIKSKFATQNVNLRQNNVAGF